MKRHLTASTVTVGTRDDRGAPASAEGRTRGVRTTAENKRTQPVTNRPNLALAKTELWMHTLVLTGELNHRSAHTLEAEIERLCEQGVTGITLDLRQLTHVDSIGVSAIAFRCKLCRSRGYDFELIPGPKLIHRVFEQAGVAELLPFQQEQLHDPAGCQSDSHPSRTRRLRA